MQIQNSNALNRKQEAQAENALTELKAQIESDSKKLYEEMKDQVNCDFQFQFNKQKTVYLNQFVYLFI